MDEIQVRGVIEEMARTPQPPVRIDLAGVRRRGRRRLRTRQGLTAGAVVLAVAGAAGTFAAARGGGQSVTGFAPAALARPVGTFDPLVEYARFGWLPSGYEQAMVAVEPGRYTITAVPAVNGLGVYAEAVQAVFFAPGRENPGEWRKETARRLVPVRAGDGREAYWRRWPKGQEGPADLVWEYAKDTWAVLRPMTTVLDDAAVLRIAESVEVGMAQRFRWRFRITGIGPELTPTSSSRAEKESGFAQSITLTEPGRPESTGRAATVRVGTGALGNELSPLPKASMTVSGHPAGTGVVGRFHSLWIYGVGRTSVGVLTAEYPEGERMRLWKGFSPVPGGTGEPIVRFGGG